LQAGVGKPVRDDGMEDNDTCSRSLKDWREALLYTGIGMAELCSQTTAAGSAFANLHQTYNSGLNLSCYSSLRNVIQPAVIGLIHRNECMECLNPDKSDLENLSEGKWESQIMRFIEEGIARLRESSNIQTAQRSFERSCKLCCFRGYRIRCDQCKVAGVFDQVKEALTFQSLSVTVTNTSHIREEK